MNNNQVRFIYMHVMCLKYKTLVFILNVSLYSHCIILLTFLYFRIVKQEHTRLYEDSNEEQNTFHIGHSI